MTFDPSFDPKKRAIFGKRNIWIWPTAILVVGAGVGVWGYMEYIKNEETQRLTEKNNEDE